MTDELNALYETVVERKRNPEQGSYTSYLFDKGEEKILKKVGEECTEVIIAAMKDDNEELVQELNDLFYHVVVLMAEKGISLEDVAEVMAKRAEKTHNLKPERRPVTEL